MGKQNSGGCDVDDNYEKWRKKFPNRSFEDYKHSECTELIDGLRRIANNPYMNQWERSFARNCSKKVYDYELSPKQKYQATKMLGVYR
jgi:hypothetical protein